MHGTVLALPAETYAPDVLILLADASFHGIGRPTTATRVAPRGGRAAGTLFWDASGTLFLGRAGSPQKGTRVEERIVWFRVPKTGTGSGSTLLGRDYVSISSSTRLVPFFGTKTGPTSSLCLFCG